MAASDTRVMTAHVPAPLADQVDALAARLDQSRGWIVKQALLTYVEAQERRRRQTIEGLADVDAGARSAARTGQGLGCEPRHRYAVAAAFVIVGDYELRYEVAEKALWILRLWHTREDR